MAERQRLGQCLWHPDDAGAQKVPSWLGRKAGQHGQGCRRRTWIDQDDAGDIFMKYFEGN